MSKCEPTSGLFAFKSIPRSKQLRTAATSPLTIALKISSDASQVELSALDLQIGVGKNIR